MLTTRILPCEACHPTTMSLADELLADLEDLEDDEDDIDAVDEGGPADDHEKDIATVVGDASISR